METSEEGEELGKPIHTELRDLPFLLNLEDAKVEPEGLG